MSKSPIEQQIERQARDALEKELQHFDAETLSRLRQGRERALQAAAAKPGWYKTGIPLALAAALLLAVGLQIIPQLSFVEDRALLAVEDEAFEAFELLVSTDEVAFYEQLDFLIWLNEQEHAG